MTSIEKRYFELKYNHKINEFYKIDDLKNWSVGTAKSKYKRLDDFYCDELSISVKELEKVINGFKEYHHLYQKYFNEYRKEFFADPKTLIEWFNNQNNSCHYCDITQEEVLKIVDLRGGNMTLNNLQKRSKGSLEIEKLDSNKGYTFDNSVLACPFCNNAKSNLISDEDWKLHFSKPMRKYLQSLIQEK
ncbi:hypothetical protein [Flammeovirga pectinis]|nr:hypothetical protein [Flammeovirga pectinis]